MGYGDTGRSPRQRGGRPVPPMRAWLTQLVTSNTATARSSSQGPASALRFNYYDGRRQQHYSEHGARTTAKPEDRSPESPDRPRRALQRYGSAFRPRRTTPDERGEDECRYPLCGPSNGWPMCMNPQQPVPETTCDFLPGQPEQPEKIGIIQQKTAESSG